MKFFKIESVDKIEGISQGTAVAIGNFDGVHIAHRQLVLSMRDFARKSGLCSLVLTFRPHTAHLFDKFGSPHLIMTYDEKIDELADLEVDIILEQHFSREFADLSTEEFLYNYLARLNVRAVFVGFDFIFGRGGQSGADELRDFGRKTGAFIHIMDPVILNGSRVSSTRIRNLLMEGNVEMANQLLGRRYFIGGIVKRGKMLGKSIQCPTANIPIVDRLSPREGVYLTVTVIGNNRYRSISNIGKTSSEKNITMLETHIFDFDRELYDEKIRVEFIRFIRPEIRFNSMEEMKETIRKDIEYARREFQGLNENF